MKKLQGCLNHITNACKYFITNKKYAFAFLHIKENSKFLSQVFELIGVHFGILVENQNIILAIRKNFL
jgi:hypothetical protein